MMTEKELAEKRQKKTDRLVLVFFLVLICIPVFLFLIAPEGPGRVNRLYFAGYAVMAAAIYYSTHGIRRILSRQKPPILETMLTKTQTAAVFPQEYLNIAEQTKRSLQSRRYFRRSLARRLTPLLESKETALSDPRLANIIALLREPEERRDEPPANQGVWDTLSGIMNRIGDFLDSITGRGMPAEELQKIITSLKEL